MSYLPVVLQNVVILDTLGDGNLLRHRYQVLKVFVRDVVHLLRMNCIPCSTTQKHKSEKMSDI